MNKELIIDSSPNGATIALLQDKQLVELHKEQISNNYTVGDIYLGRIKKLMPGLNAAFVDVGYEKDAFLHYLDLGPQVQSLLKLTKQVRGGSYKSKLLDGLKLDDDISKGGKISEVLVKNQLVPVQIAKEPISTKGPRISSELSLAGRFIVLVPFSDRVSISQKIESKEEKERLKRLVQSIKPKGFGVIVRTVAEGKTTAELEKDLQNLLSRWTAMCKKLPTAHHPSKVLGELNRASSILRDVFNDSFTGIHIDDEELYYQTKDYLMEIAPSKQSIVKFYQSKDTPIFEK